MLWRVDRSDPTALHDQLAACVRRAMADSSLVAGEQLPPARDLALIVDVNANTVLRAYRTLRTEGLVEFRRGRGVRVCATAARHAPVTAAAHDLLRLGRLHGYGRDELIALLSDLHRGPA